MCLPLSSTSANGVSLSFPRRVLNDSKLTLVLGIGDERYDQLLIFSMSVKLSSVLNMTSLFPLIPFRGIEGLIGLSMIWLIFLFFLELVNWIIFHILIICSILLMLIIVFLTLYCLQSSWQKLFVLGDEFIITPRLVLFIVDYEVLFLVGEICRMC